MDAPGVHDPADGHPRAMPGLVQVFAKAGPFFRVFRGNGRPLALGRLELSRPDELDSTISRKHIRFHYNGASWMVRDLESRNGSFVGGQRVRGERVVSPGEPVRVESALLLALADVSPFEEHAVRASGDRVVGPRLHAALQQVVQASRLGRTLLITGESGSGKELAALTFHGAGSAPEAAFVPVNCGAIPKDLAERLLFGSKRGAFSGATEADGYIHAARGGTLFLDEIAELPLDAQSKLLRLVETQQVMRLGATRYESLDVRICAATWRDLRDEVALGRFREDLYFRIGQPEVRVPALRERLEEIPWHVEQTLRECAPQLAFTAAFVEGCMLRPWPGNIRELRAEVRRAAAAALAQGLPGLALEALSPTAGTTIVKAGVSSSGSGVPEESSTAYPQDDFFAALTAETGNVSRAAQRLGVHRNRVRRWIERYGGVAGDFRVKRAGRRN